MSIKTIAKFGENGMTAYDALKYANKNKLRILSNKEIDGRLVRSDLWKTEKTAYPLWAGTLIAYVAPGEKFGKYVKYHDGLDRFTYYFPVPEEYRGEKNALLAINHGFDKKGRPLIQMCKGKKDDIFIEIRDSSKIKIIGNFPEKEHHPYVIDKEFSIPCGKRIKSDPTLHYTQIDESMAETVRVLGRKESGFVGFGVRGCSVNFCFGYGDGRKLVFQVSNPSFPLGLMVTDDIMA